jgi:biotin synthase
MKIKKLKNIGVDRISFALDAVTEQIFSKVKGENIGGPFSWKKHREALHDAVRVLGEGSVSTHLIVGLGETEKELCQTIQWCVDSGIYPGLFAFTPISGTTLENNPQPTLTNYRRIQLAQYLITNRKTRIENMEFDTNETLKNFGIHQKNLLEIIDNGKPFLTSGCPGCNRPYYNESPSGPTYNFPRQLQPKEIEKVKKSLNF